MIIVAARKRAWYHRLARTWRRCSAIASPKTPQSSAATLPLEIIEMIIAPLVHDIPSLRACSLTCYSWYIAAVPQLHHTFLAPLDYCQLLGDQRFAWSVPLPDMRKLGLLPLVKKFRIRRRFIHDPPYLFSPERFNDCTLHHFSALTNVQELVIDCLDIPSFMPEIHPYFGHFLPSVRSLVLEAPKGSCRQIIYFIGLFQHLDDLELLYNPHDPQDELVDDPTLVPSFAPPLRGQLTLTVFTKVDILKGMIDLFEGIRFRRMDLYDVHGVGLLLDACAETLETLRLYPADLRGKEHSLNNTQVPADNLAAVHSIGDFNLSRNKSLRTLEVTAFHIGIAMLCHSPNTAMRPLTYALSTITSPMFSEVIVFYRERDFDVVPMHRQQFKGFRMMYKVRGFRLALCVDAWGGKMERYVRRLKMVVAAERENKGFNDIYLEPPVFYSPRRSRRIPGALEPWVSL